MVCWAVTGLQGWMIHHRQELVFEMHSPAFVFLHVVFQHVGPCLTQSYHRCSKYQNGLIFIGDFGIGKKRALSAAGAPGLCDQQIPFWQAKEIDR